MREPPCAPHPNPLPKGEGPDCEGTGLRGTGSDLLARRAGSVGDERHVQRRIFTRRVTRGLRQPATAAAPAPGAAPAKPAGSAEALVRELFGLAGIAIGGPGPATSTVHDPRFYERVLRDASLGVGESYMDGWWETDALDVTDRQDHAREPASRRSPGSWRLRAADRRRRCCSTCRRRRAPARRSRRTTTSATTSTRACSTRAWSTPAATGRTRRRWPRRRKPSSIWSAARSASSPGMRVLDLGCGWGGFASWAAEKYGCSVLGVTLSKDQIALGARCGSTWTSSCGCATTATSAARSIASCRSA